MIPAARFLTVLAACSLLISCQNGKSSGGSDPYVANYGNDGGYNPYPGQPGYAQGSSSYSSTPTYTPPPAPVEADPYAFNAPTSAPSSSSSSYTAPKKTTPTSSKPKTTAKSTPAKKSSSSGGGSYKVVQGDTLYGIARKRNSTVAKIKAANGLTSDLIRPGQTLKIP